MKWSLYWQHVCFFLQSLCARWIASAKARAKTVFGHLKLVQPNWINFNVNKFFSAPDKVLAIKNSFAKIGRQELVLWTQITRAWESSLTSSFRLFDKQTPCCRESVKYYYNSTSFLSRMPLTDWLRYSLSILWVAKQCALGAPFCFWSVIEEDLDKGFGRLVDL